MAERQLPKLHTGVRFPSPAPDKTDTFGQPCSVAMPPSDPDIAPPALQIVTQAALPAALADSPFGPFVLQPCAGRDAVLARLAAGGCDALVLDDGADAIDLLAEAERDVAILVVAASPDPAAVLAWLARGAQDVLRIDELGAASLPQRLRAAIERKRLAREARTAYATDLD